MQMSHGDNRYSSCDRTDYLETLGTLSYHYAYINNIIDNIISCGIVEH